MKKRGFAGFLPLLLILLLLPMAAVPASARGFQTGNATTDTFTPSSEGGMVRTQDAYLTGEVLFLNSPLAAPEDLCVKRGVLYVADSRNGRVVCKNLADGRSWAVGEGILNFPTGIFVTDAGELYVADQGWGKVFVLDSEGGLLREYGRPETAAFGKDAQYKPKKVAVDSSGILSVVSEGSFDGIIQLSGEGEFLGYFGYNAVPVTFLEMLQDKFFTKAQKEQLFRRIPLTFYNIAQDSQGISYTITQGIDSGALKKHNISGVDILNAQAGAENFSDLCIGPDGQIFVVTETGVIYEYDNDGELLFTFGGRAVSSERSGLFTLAVGIAADDNCNLYVLDKERGVVHTFAPTAFAGRLHSAVGSYRDGRYEESRSELQILLRQAGNIRMIYNYLGKNEIQLRNYDAAAEYFYNAGNRREYSEAFWELRNAAGARALPWFLLAVAALFILLFLRKALRRRRRGERPARSSTQNRFLSDLEFSVRFFRHPFEGFSAVKAGTRGNLLTATLLYLLAFLVFAADYLLRGFAFSAQSLENTSPFYVLMLFFLPVGLFVLCSYMVSEIHDGEGRLKTMYIGMGYSLMPFVCLLPIVTVLTHVLSLNEAFLVNFGSVFIYVWTAALLFLSIKELHNYEFHQVFANLLLTLFLMVVVIFAASILGMFWDKVAEMVSSVWKEVIYRVG